MWGASGKHHSQQQIGRWSQWCCWTNSIVFVARNTNGNLSSQQLVATSRLKSTGTVNTNTSSYMRNERNGTERHETWTIRLRVTSNIYARLFQLLSYLPVRLCCYNNYYCCFNVRVTNKRSETIQIIAIRNKMN